MDKSTTQFLLNLVDFKCPLCNEKFRIKYNLRNHLKREHTDAEAEKYLKIVGNNI